MENEELLNEAASLIGRLLGWKPDDMSGDEMPSEWIEAEEFLTRLKARKK
jgi:hypothetical protein